jgi:hypothetical protein
VGEEDALGLVGGRLAHAECAVVGWFGSTEPLLGLYGAFDAAAVEPGAAYRGAGRPR